jgi:hypothetical protein
VNDFVEECRKEWRRLGVANPLAEEMASDLASDLAEAEAEGVSAEEFLGRNIFDPGSFAAAWATERGIIPVRPTRGNTGRRPLVLVAFTAFAAIALVIAALLILTGEPKLSVVTSRTGQPHLPSVPPSPFGPTGPSRLVPQPNTSAPVEWILLFFAIIALAFAAWLWSRWGRSRPTTVAA